METNRTYIQRVGAANASKKTWLYIAGAVTLGMLLGVVIVTAFMRPSSVHTELYPGENNSPQAAVEYINRSGLVAINEEDFDAAAQKVCAALKKTDIESLENPEQAWVGPEREAGELIENAESFEVAGLDEVKDEQARNTVVATGRRLVMESAAMFACPSQLARMNATFSLN